MNDRPPVDGSDLGPAFALVLLMYVISLFVWSLL